MAAGKYRTIVADPPWDHSDGTGTTMRDGKWVGTSVPYDCMTLSEIAALPVRDMAERDAHLYLWTTNRYLRDAYYIAEAWLAATVRGARWRATHRPHRDEFDAALAALVEHARTLERERGDLAVKLVVSSAGGIHALQDRARAAGARADRYEKALTALVEHIDLNGGCHRDCPEHEAARAALAGEDA